MDWRPLIHWHSSVYWGLKSNCFTNVLREMSYLEQSGLAKSLILKDTRYGKTVVHLFFVYVVAFVAENNDHQKKRISQLLLRHTKRRNSFLSRIQKIFN